MERYCTEIILDHVHLFMSAISPDTLFTDDNALPHRNAEALITAESEDINTMQRHVSSLDLNPIQYVCNALCENFLLMPRPFKS